MFAIYLALNQNHFTDASGYVAAWLLNSAHFVFATVTLFSIRGDVEKHNMRRVSGILVDQMLLAAALYTIGKAAAPFILMPMLFTLGSGLRYGRSYAFFSSTVSITLTVIVLFCSPYWEQRPEVRAGIAIATILLPFYVFRLTDQLALTTRTDSLTQLRNRMGFDELLEEVCRDSALGGRMNALVLLDLDGFKKINDEQGHDGGDAVLKHVAYWLSIELGPLGVPVRLGGDEFAVVVRELSNGSELEIAIAQFLKRTRDVGQLFGSPLSASVGLCYIEASTGVAPRFAFKAADELMYLAKRSGKNQFMTSTGKNFAEDGSLVTP